MPHLPLLALIVLIALQSPAPEKPGLTVIAPPRGRRRSSPSCARGPLIRGSSATIEDLVAKEDGVDAPEKIKRTLHRGWRERRVRYASLARDRQSVPHLGTGPAAPHGVGWAASA